MLVLVFVAACGPGHRGGGGDDFGEGGPDGGGGSACAAETIKAQMIPLDLFIMLDQSNSMTDAVAGGTKWTTVTSALNTFVQQPGLDGVSVGLGYFALPQSSGGTCSALTCTTDADCGATACGPCLANLCFGAISMAGDSCNAADYAKARQARSDSASARAADLAPVIEDIRAGGAISLR